MNTIASNHNSFKKKLLYDKVWKFDINNIYPKYIKVYTDIDPTVDFIFPVNQIDRKTVKKIFLKTNLKLTKCIFRSCNVWKLSKELNMFLLLTWTGAHYSDPYA